MAYRSAAIGTPSIVRRRRNAHSQEKFVTY